jgi:hypothetical protein
MSEPQVPVYDAGEPSEEGKRLAGIFSDIESKQPEFLDSSAQTMIQQVATIFTVFFGITAFGSTFPPPYLKGNLTSKYLVIATLVLYFATLGASLRALRPRRYTIRYYHATGQFDGKSMKAILDEIINHKMFWVRWARIFFALGSLALIALIVSIIWNV